MFLSNRFQNLCQAMLNDINFTLRRLLFFIILLPFLVSAQSALSQTQVSSRKSAQLQSRFAKLNEMRVHYQNIGQGSKALIFVHGWTCDLNSWQLQIPFFKDKVRVIVIELPGHGQSDSPHVAYTQDLFAKAIDAVLKDAGVKRAVLVGHSMGAPVVRQFYRLYPKKSRGLVFVDGALRPTTSKENMERFIASLRDSNYQAMISGMADGMLGRQIPVILREKMKLAMLRTPQHVTVSTGEGMTDQYLWREDKIDIPVLAIFARSPIWKPDNEIFYRSFTPNLEYQMWDDVGHFLMIEKPQKFNETLATFLVRIEFLKK